LVSRAVVDDHDGEVLGVRIPVRGDDQVIGGRDYYGVAEVSGSGTTRQLTVDLPAGSDFGGVEKVAPVLAGMLLIGGLATAGLPGLSPFISEFLVLVSAFSHAWWAGAVAVTGIVLAAIYVLWMYQRTMTGPTAPTAEGAQDLGVREIGAVAPLMVALVVFGFYPAPLLDVSNPMIADLMSEVGVSDTPPTVNGEASGGSDR
jgi:NADH:ubiquinone oxidoreductase subunit 4 (subunit M)